MYIQEDASTTALAKIFLAVTIGHCPAVKHLHAKGRTISAWYRYTTEVVIKSFADANSFQFAMENYD